MRNRSTPTVLWALLLAASLNMASAEPTAALPPADLILKNASIETASRLGRHFAIRGGLIAAIGDSTDIAALAGPKTRQIDLGGDTVLPGLHDLHVHPVFAGISAKECSIPQGSSLAGDAKESSKPA